MTNVNSGLKTPVKVKSSAAVAVATPETEIFEKSAACWVSTPVIATVPEPEMAWPSASSAEMLSENPSLRVILPSGPKTTLDPDCNVVRSSTLAACAMVVAF